MVIDGNLTEQDIDRIHTLFDESLLPYKVDVNALNLITYPPLKEYVDAVFFSITISSGFSKK
jgi:hypothetical protein